ncbi:MAG: phage portal protein [Sphingobacterium sp.]
MGLFQKIFSGKVEKKELGSPLPEWQFINATFTPYGQNDDEYIAAYHRTAFVYSLLSWIVDKAASVPIEAYKVESGTKYRKYKAQLSAATSTKGIAKAMITKAEALEQLENHPALDLLYNPSPNFTGKETFEQLFGYYLLTGNAYLYLATPGVGLNATKPVQLWNIPSPSVQIVGGDKMNMVAGYKVSYSNDTIDPSKIIHVKAFNPVSNLNVATQMLYGQSPLQALTRQVTVLDHSDTAQGTLFRNMAPVGILSQDKVENPKQMLSQEQAGQIRDQFLRNHTGSVKGGGIVITPANVKWEKIGLSPVDMNILEGKRSLKEDLCNAYHVPIELFSSDSGGLTSQGQAMEQAMKQALSDCIIPLVNRFVEALNRELMVRYGDGVVLQADFSVFDALQDDMKAQAEWLAQAPYITPNEKRKYMGFDHLPDPNMDKIYFPSGQVPLDQLNGEVADVEDIDPDTLPL